MKKLTKKARDDDIIKYEPKTPQDKVVIYDGFLHPYRNELKIQYKGQDGVCIVKISENKYYYGNGKTVNAIGISANQFLRFNPYMDYVGDKNEVPNKKIMAWIRKHAVDTR